MELDGRATSESCVPQSFVSKSLIENYFILLLTHFLRIDSIFTGRRHDCIYLPLSPRPSFWVLSDELVAEGRKLTASKMTEWNKVGVSSIIMVRVTNSHVLPAGRL